MNSLIPKLESQGKWELALNLSKIELLKKDNTTSDDFHIIGRLYQRLGKFIPARRAYIKALEINKFLPKTLNNLILLDLNLFKIKQANIWLKNALTIKDASFKDKELIYGSACELKLFELKHFEALKYVEKQIEIRDSVIALCNRSICLQKLNRIDEAINSQLNALRLQLEIHDKALLEEDLKNLIGVSCGDLEQSINLQTILMNLAVLKLSKNQYDQDSLKLLNSGMSNDRDYWLNSDKSNSIWKGEETNKLILWDDQGYGDSIQNIAWINSVSNRAKEIEIWLRPSLINLIRERFTMPMNCSLKPLKANKVPWSKSSKHLGLFFLPFVLGEWREENLKSYLGCINRENHSRPLIKKSHRIGLVWNAGKHSSPQPERNARIRDIEFNSLWDIAEKWKKKYNVDLISLQLLGNEEESVQRKINNGELLNPLKSYDWLETAKILDNIDVIVSVDTSVAHLAGAMNIPCILMLSCPSDWRWGQEISETYIYESFRICRCNQPGNWNLALVQANEFICKLIAPEITY